MRAETAEFIRDLDDLSKLLKRTELEEQLLAADASEAPHLAALLEQVRSSIEPFALKRANYSMMVVVLYSSFERFVDELIIRTLDAVNDLIPTIEHVPRSVRQSHRRKTLDALSDETWLERQPEADISRTLIERLHLCESGSQEYRLNAIAYTRHTANYRTASIARAFHELGIENFTRQASDARPFRLYLEQGQRERGMFDNSMGAIDDLAARRNDVAHGNTTDILSPIQIAEYVEFFKAVALSYFELIRAHLTSFSVAHWGMRLGRPSKVHYKSVVVLDLAPLPNGTRLNVGDPIAMQRPRGDQYDCGRIINIRTANGDVNSVLSEANQLAAIQVDFRLRHDRLLFLVKRVAPCQWIADTSPI